MAAQRDKVQSLGYKSRYGQKNSGGRINRVAVVVATFLLFAVGVNAQAQSANTDIYHVHFVKAALGQAKALENDLKKQDPKAPVPDIIWSCVIRMAMIGIT